VNPTISDKIAAHLITGNDVESYEWCVSSVVRCLDCLGLEAQDQSKSKSKVSFNIARQTHTVNNENMTQKVVHKIREYA